MKKRLLSLAAAVTMLTSVFTPVYANEIDLDITADDDVTLGLSLDEDELLKDAKPEWCDWDAYTGTLTLSGQLPSTYRRGAAGVVITRSLAYYADIDPSAIKHIVITSGTKTDTKASYMFYEMDNLIDIQGLQNLNTSAATDMNRMFCGCSSIRSLDLSGFDVRNVTDMSAMFYECYALETLDVKAWNTLALQNTRYMFYNCTALGGLEFRSEWETEKVTDFSGMFAGCSSLEKLYLGAFDIRSANTLDEMFIDCESLISLDLSGWKMPGGASAADMFLGCTSLETICLYQ